MKIFMSHFKYNNLQISGQLFLGNFHQFSLIEFNLAGVQTLVWQPPKL